MEIIEYGSELAYSPLPSMVNPSAAYFRKKGMRSLSVCPVRMLIRIRMTGVTGY